MSGCYDSMALVRARREGTYMNRLSESSYTTPAFTPGEAPAMGVEEVVEANTMMRFMSPIAIVQWAHERFGKRVRVDTSFGMDSALICDVVAESGTGVGFIFGNTRLLAPETYDQGNALLDLYSMDLEIARPSDKAKADVTNRHLWRSSKREDLDEFLEKVKLGPLRRMDHRLGKLATLGAARRDQTLDRESLNYVVRGNDGRVRIYPFLLWKQSMVDDYIDSRGLPRNRLPQLYGPDAISHRNIVYFNGKIEIAAFDSCGRNSPDGRPVHSV
jgi:phosphoadenosine phosphosulfate reductase